MEYVSGGSLEDHLQRRGHLNWDEAVTFLTPIVGALSHAHGADVLHRDIKPANILLTKSGVPKLADFGIAAAVGSTVTQSAFTLAHAAPETFSDGIDRRDERSDLYSLASTLFTMVTGRDPFAVAGADLPQAYMNRILSNPVPILASPAHDQFFTRALAKNPTDRPTTADQFGAELLSVKQTSSASLVATPLESKTTTDRPSKDQTKTQLATTSPRRRRPGWLVPVVALGLVLAASAGAWALLSGQTSETTPDTEPNQASPTTTSLSTTLEPTPTSVANEEATTTSTTEVEIPEAPTEPVVFDIVNSTTAKVVGGNRVLVAGADGALVMYDMDNPDASAQLVASSTSFAIAELPDGRIAISEESMIRILDLDNPSSVQPSFSDYGTTAFALITLDDGRLAIGSDDGVHLWDPLSPDETATIYPGHRLRVNALTQLSDGRIASAGMDGTVQVWDPNDIDAAPVRFGQHRSWVDQVVELADGRLVSAEPNFEIFVWDPDNLETAPIRVGEPYSTSASAALPDGRLLFLEDAAVLEEPWLHTVTVLAWDPATGEVNKVFEGHTSRGGNFGAHLDILPDGRVLSMSEDEVIIWNPNT